MPSRALLEALGALEGRWISPDPLALAIRSPNLKDEEAVALAREREARDAEPVVGYQEVLAGLTAQLKPADRYRVRFLVKAPAS